MIRSKSPSVAGYSGDWPLASAGWPAMDYLDPPATEFPGSGSIAGVFPGQSIVYTMFGGRTKEFSKYPHKIFFDVYPKGK